VLWLVLKKSFRQAEYIQQINILGTDGLYSYSNDNST
jgi:hypothetical protein